MEDKPTYTFEEIFLNRDFFEKLQKTASISSHSKESSFAAYLKDGKVFFTKPLQEYHNCCFSGENNGMIYGIPGEGLQPPNWEPIIVHTHFHPTGNFLAPSRGDLSSDYMTQSYIFDEKEGVTYELLILKVVGLMDSRNNIGLSIRLPLSIPADLDLESVYARTVLASYSELNNPNFPTNALEFLEKTGFYRTHLIHFKKGDFSSYREQIRFLGTLPTHIRSKEDFEKITKDVIEKRSLDEYLLEELEREIEERNCLFVDQDSDCSIY